MNAKPTVAELGIDLGAQDWQRSGDGDGALEIAFVAQAPGAGTQAAQAPGTGTQAAQAPGTGTQAAQAPGTGTQAAQAPGTGTEWVLMRVAGDPDGRVLVYDRNEWECFLDGVRAGEFDDAAG